MNYKEMARLSSDPVAVQSAARAIRAAIGDRLNLRDRKLLEQLEKFDGSRMMSMEEKEDLHRLRSRSSRRAIVKGHRASDLILRLWEARFDFNEEAEEFLNSLREKVLKHGKELELSKNQWGYAFVLAKKIGEIEGFVAIDG
jgi:hypothetical protein